MRALVLFCCAAFFCASAWAQEQTPAASPPSVEERLKAMEERIRALEPAHVHAVEQMGPPCRVPHVQHVGVGGGRGRPVRLVQHHVHAHDVVASRCQGAVDGAADEPGRAGEQDPQSAQLSGTRQW